jgi:hypothetical protein
MKTFFFTGFIGCFWAGILFGQTPTWADQIACISYTRCTPCHHPAGLGPYSMVTYAEAYPARISIMESMISRFMPPWQTSPSYGRVAHETYVTQEELAMIVAWVSAGAPEGDASQTPSPPDYTSNTPTINASKIVQIPTYQNPELLDNYRCFVLPLNLDRDTLLTQLEVIPGNKRMVHHVMVYWDTSGVPAQLDAQDPLPGYYSFGGTGSLESVPIYSWAPDWPVYSAPAGTGVKLPQNAVLVVQMHYTYGVQNQIDSTKLVLKYGSGNLREIQTTALLNHYTNINEPLLIPANTIKSFNCELQLNEGQSLWAISPHMHYIGKDIKVYAIKPGADTVPLIYIPDWNYAWQGIYPFRRPVYLPIGTVLRAEATYNNTLSNPRNPNYPLQTVGVGNLPTDEMLMVYFSLISPGLVEDSLLWVDSSSVVNTYGGCDFSLGTENNETVSEILVYPNPADADFNVIWIHSSPSIRESWVDVINSSGNVVRRLTLDLDQSRTEFKLNAADFAGGLYIFRDSLGRTKKILIL